MIPIPVLVMKIFGDGRSTKVPSSQLCLKRVKPGWPGRHSCSGGVAVELSLAGFEAARRRGNAQPIRIFGL